MIDIVKEAFNISLDKPLYAGKANLYLAKYRFALPA